MLSVGPMASRTLIRALRPILAPLGDVILKTLQSLAKDVPDQVTLAPSRDESNCPEAFVDLLREVDGTQHEALLRTLGHRTLPS